MIADSMVSLLLMATLMPHGDDNSVMQCSIHTIDYTVRQQHKVALQMRGRGTVVGP